VKYFNIIFLKYVIWTTIPVVHYQMTGIGQVLSYLIVEAPWVSTVLVVNKNYWAPRPTRANTETGNNNF